MFNRKFMAALMVSASVLTSTVPVMAAGAAGIHTAERGYVSVEHGDTGSVKEKTDAQPVADTGKTRGNKKNVPAGGNSDGDMDSVSDNGPVKKMPDKDSMSLSGNRLKKRPEKERIPHQDKTSSENARELPDVSENRIPHAEKGEKKETGRPGGETADNQESLISGIASQIGGLFG